MGMSVEEYIKGKFGEKCINISDASIEDICIRAKVNRSDEYSSDNQCAVLYGMAMAIEDILAMPTSVSESGFSASWDIDGIKSYYRSICRRIGLEDKLTDRPKISFV